MDLRKQNDSTLILRQVPCYYALISKAPRIVLLAMMSNQHTFLQWKSWVWNKRDGLLPQWPNLPWLLEVLLTTCDLFQGSWNNGSLTAWKRVFLSLGCPELPAWWSCSGQLGVKVFRKWRKATERNTEAGSNCHICVFRRSSISEKP